MSEVRLRWRLGISLGRASSSMLESSISLVKAPENFKGFEQVCLVLQSGRSFTSPLNAVTAETAAKDMSVSPWDIGFLAIYSLGA